MQGLGERPPAVCGERTMSESVIIRETLCNERRRCIMYIELKEARDLPGDGVANEKRNEHEYTLLLLRIGLCRERVRECERDTSQGRCVNNVYASCRHSVQKKCVTIIILFHNCNSGVITTIIYVMRCTHPNDETRRNLRFLPAPLPNTSLLPQPWLLSCCTRSRDSHTVLHIIICVQLPYENTRYDMHTKCRPL